MSMSILDLVEGHEYDLEAGCAVLENLEREPPDQTNSDTLWVELRLACAEIKRLRGPTTVHMLEQAEDVHSLWHTEEQARNEIKWLTAEDNQAGVGFSVRSILVRGTRP